MIVVGASLMAQEMEVVAHALDRIELQFRRHLNFAKKGQYGPQRPASG
jgi:hypothetical protein